VKKPVVIDFKKSVGEISSPVLSLGLFFREYIQAAIIFGLGR
jgi:hypothetical protein